MTWLHTWTGLLFSWLLYFMFATGSLGYFDAEIDAWMQPEIHSERIADSTELLRYTDVAHNWLLQHAADAESWQISAPNQRENPQLRVIANSRDKASNKLEKLDEILDVESGQPLSTRASGGGQTLYKMHYLLHYLPGNIGYRFVGLVTMVMFIGLITGVVVHKKIFKELFTFRPGKKARSWLDLHNLLAVCTLPFQFMITYSGLIFVFTLWMPLIGVGMYGFDIPQLRSEVNTLKGLVKIEPSGQPAPRLALHAAVNTSAKLFGTENINLILINHPSDANASIVVYANPDSISQFRETLRFDGVSGKLIAHIEAPTSKALSVRDSFIGLHEGLFAGTGLRWLYFLSGLAGMGMIATGAIYWSVKRDKKNPVPDNRHTGHRLVEHLNVGVFVGLPIGIACYFLANRLLPVTLSARADWEIHSLFLAWLACQLYTLLRPHRPAWSELLWLAAVVYMTIPIVNAIATDRGLLASIRNQDWVFVGFDLSCLFFGLVFAVGAYLAGKNGAGLHNTSSTKNISLTVRKTGQVADNTMET